MYKFRKNNVSVLVVVDKRRMKNNGRYPVKIEVICRRKQKYYPTGKDVTLNEWDTMWNSRRLSEKGASIESSFNFIRTQVEELTNIGRFSFASLDSRLGYNMMSVNDILRNKMNSILKQGRINSYYRYRSTLKALETYGGPKIDFNAVTSEWLERCESAWVKEGRSETTISIYMKTLRCIFNEAVDSGIIRETECPFGKNKYRIPKAKKREMALTKEQIISIQEWHGDSKTEYWRDLWLFSYLCNGVNFRDMLFLRYRDIIDGEICFIRSKTAKTNGRSQVIKVPILPEMKRIMERSGRGIHGDPDSYIFRHAMNQSRPMEVSLLTRKVINKCNNALKKIARDLKIPSFSTYSARHSFATILMRSGADMKYISESLGHANIEMTWNYIAGFDRDERMRYASMLL